MRWSEATTLEFVKIYLKHECLWNPNHRSYRTKYKREKAYTQIISEFRESTGKNLAIAEVKMKIKNLRTTYAQQVQKILRKSNPSSIYEPSLIWFHEMDQCLKNVPTKLNKHFSSYSQETSEIDSSNQSVWNGQDLLSSGIEDVISDPLIAQPSDEDYNTQEENVTLKIKIDQFNPIKYKINQKKPNSNEEYLIEEKAVSSLNEDEFDIYGKYIASQLRQMNLQKALKIQLEIQNLISGVRIIKDVNN